MIRRLLPALLPLCLLAGCGDDAGNADQRTASGEVLQGTISDAMLPLDNLRSQAPLAQPAAKKVAGDEAATTTDGATPAAPAAGPAPAPGFEDAGGN